VVVVRGDDEEEQAKGIIKHCIRGRLPNIRNRGTAGETAGAAGNRRPNPR